MNNLVYRTTKPLGRHQSCHKMWFSKCHLEETEKKMPVEEHEKDLSNLIKYKQNGGTIPKHFSMWVY